MLVKGVDIELYAANFSMDQIDAVIQFHEIFGGNDELIEALHILGSEKALPERPKPPKQKEEEEKPEPHSHFCEHCAIPLELCKKCNSLVHGWKMPGCETERIFYKECTNKNCTYYGETLKMDEKIIISEG